VGLPPTSSSGAWHPAHVAGNGLLEDGPTNEEREASAQEGCAPRSRTQPSVHRLTQFGIDDKPFYIAQRQARRRDGPDGQPDLPDWSSPW